MKNILSIASLLLVAMFLAAGCRGEEPIVPSEQVPVVFPDPAPGDIKGFFLLNEANMGSNKASLDYFDYETGVYHRNIFPERNPMVVHELGDVGNDLQIYDDRLWAVINCSNFVRVMDVQTAREVGTFSVPNCRYIVFDGDFAYVSSYAGPVLIDRNSRIGKVVKVDIHTLETVAECTVGYQPEQMAVAGDKLYVANSGGYRAPDYDTTVSVIDLASFTETRKIDTGVGNLHRMELDQYGRLWILSRGDSHGNGSKTIVIDSATDRVTDIFDLPGSNMTRLGDTLYVYNTRLHGSDNTTSYATIDTRTKQISTRNFITDGT
jgi:hypothetical protein